MSQRRNLPPLRSCPSCGREHRAYAEHGPCTGCRARSLENQNALADLALDQRLARRQQTVDTLEPVRAGVPYNEFPPGF